MPAREAPATKRPPTKNSAPTAEAAAAVAAAQKANVGFMLSSSIVSDSLHPDLQASQHAPMSATARGGPPGTAPSSEDLSTAASVLTSISNSVPVAYTPTTHRISKAKKGKKVHVCEFGCGKVFSRAEHRRRHEANHRTEPLFRCNEPGCEKTFQRPDLLGRHLERQHNVRGGGDGVHAEHEAGANNGASADTLVAELSKFTGNPNSPGSNDLHGLDAFSEELRDLYLRQGRPLREIKSYMEAKHGLAPIDDHVYEQAFSRLCLGKGDSPAPTAPMYPPGGSNMRPDWNVHATERSGRAGDGSQLLQSYAAGGWLYAADASATDDPYPDSESGRFDGAHLASALAAEEAKDDANRIPLDPLLPRQHDCPAPECDRRGPEGFISRDQLWDHLVAKHGMKHPRR